MTDITPLKDLTQLVYLDLQDNQVTDVSVIAGLTNMNRLFLDGNPIADYSVLTDVRSNLEEWDFHIPGQE